MGLSQSVKDLIADLLQCQAEAIIINHCDVQWQSGYNDCGIFCIAFATAICAGSNPVSKIYDQGKIRYHLLQCLETGVLRPFPERSCKRVIKAALQEELPIYCICRLPYKGEIMVQCEKCREWFHPDCGKIPKIC